MNDKPASKSPEVVTSKGIGSSDLLAQVPDVHARRLRLLRWIPGPDKEPAKPMWIGGRNGSHHSPDLCAMAKMGLVEKVRWGGWDRGSCRYRRTPAGDLYLANDQDQPRR